MCMCARSAGIGRRHGCSSCNGSATALFGPPPMSAETDARTLRHLRRHIALPRLLRPMHLRWLRWRDQSTAGRVRRMLDTEQIPGIDPMRRPVREALRGRTTEDLPLPDLIPGDRLGPWRIVDLLAQGGMGNIYIAERDDGAYHQQVAIKRIRSDAASRMATETFLREREILARLSHPGISRLIDGGFDTQGRPWLAMELIRGERIDAWCDRHRCTIRVRVELFLQLCDAVHDAHRHGVLHGDIKPANLLVDSDGRVKLVDFGVAALLDNAEDPAVCAGITEAYAAPERIAQDAHGFASDVYGLGAVLCRLIVGTPPRTGPLPMMFGLFSIDAQARFDSGALLEHIDDQALRARGLTDRRALARLLSTDLDAILSKCLHPCPEDRYPDAAALGQDLRRWLASQPVTAAGRGGGYRLRKFLLRHRMTAWFSLSSALVFAAILATQWQARQNAENRFAELNLVFEDSLGSATMAGLGEVGLNSRDLLELTESRLRASKSANDDETLAYGLLALSRSQITAGDYQHAFRLIEEARRRGRTQRSIRLRADAIGAAILNQQARYQDAERVAEAALRDGERVVFGSGNEPTKVSLSTELARARWHQGRHSEARKMLDLTIVAAAELQGDAARLLPELLTLRAQWKTDLYESASAKQDLERALQLTGSRYPHLANQARLAMVRTLLRMNRQQEADRLARTTLAAFEKIYGSDHPETGRALLACIEAMLSTVMIGPEQTGTAFAYSQRAMHILKHSLGESHPLYTESLKYSAYVRAFTGDGEPHEIIAQARASVDLLRADRGATLEQQISAKITLADILSEFSIALDDRRMFDESLALYRQVEAQTAREKIPIPHQLSLYARALNERGDIAEARRVLARANAEVARYLGRDHALLAFNNLLLAKIAIDAGDDPAALRPLDEVMRVTTARNDPSKNVRLTRFGALYMRAGIHERRGESTQAQSLLREAIAYGAIAHEDPKHPKILELGAKLRDLENAAHDRSLSESRPVD
ncbi:MAG: serine/threonine protein kinase [Lysobacteraceae bacterium]|nr:MAG: serine/threonine protein kinase [Xanthomonadaceae bacterium]